MSSIMQNYMKLYHYLRRSVSSFASINEQSIRTLSANTIVELDTKEECLKSWQEIPGPSILPLIGQIHHFFPGGSLANVKEPIMNVLYKEFGPIVKIHGHFGAPTMLVLFDAEACAQVLRGENRMPERHNFASMEYFRNKVLKTNKMDADAPTGLISDQGEKWKKFRSIVNPIMLQPKTIRLYASTLNEVAEDMVKRLRSKRNEKNMIEGKFDQEMNLWALESIGVVALGARINCLDPNQPNDSPVKKLIQVVRDCFVAINDLEYKPSLWRYISTPAFKQGMQHYNDQIELSKYFVQKAREDFKTTDSCASKEKSVLEKLLEIDERIAIIMASDMLFAGVDTASTTMILTLYFLANNPEKQNKLREEIMSESEKRPYLKACLKESIRIMPVVAGNIRTTSREYNIIGYKIPQNEHFPKPKEYIPERWLTDKDDPLYYGNAHPFAYSPFGFGTRSCVGRRIAELETETFLAKIIENFQVEWFGPPMQTKLTTLNYAIGPFNFIFKDVK